MRNKVDNRLMVVTAATLLSLMGGQLQAQDEPYVVHEITPVIVEGPWLVAPTADGVSIVWVTDSECHSQVEFGTSADLGRVAENDRHGLLPIGTLHAVRLTGLTPGETCWYRVVSTMVVKMKAYWPEKGLSVESPVYQFTVPDPGQSEVSFSFLADTQHGDLPRIGANLDAVDWNGLDFFVHGGDAFGSLESEEQLLEKLIHPVLERLGHGIPLVFVRGNHEMRGSFARHLHDYVPAPEGEFYYAFDAGPAHFLVLDTGEDKDDDTNVYAGLNRTEPYREKEFAWFEEHARIDERFSEAPFRIILMHAPRWGWVDGDNDRWTGLANRTGIDLVLAGHNHRYSWSPPGSDGREYAVLVVGQDQVADVRVGVDEITMKVTDADGTDVAVHSISRSEVRAPSQGDT